jgi:alpha-beta hydrolase superfamily lysophospholipase
MAHCLLARSGMNEEMFEGKDGIKLFMRSWRPSGTPRGVIVLVHGFKSHSGLYEWAAEQLMTLGLSVYAFDLRGNGKSEGERMYVDKFSDYVGDLERFIDLVRAREPNLPVFLLGHSAGGVVSCLYSLQHQKELAGLICESFAQELPAPHIALSLLKGLSSIAPHLHVLKLSDDVFSRDKAFLDRMKVDPLIPHMLAPSQTAAELIRADEKLGGEFQQLTLPLFIMHGTGDKAASPHGSQHFYDAAGSEDKTLKLYEGHYHDLLNDVGKEKVINDIGVWISEHLTPNAGV